MTSIGPFDIEAPLREGPRFLLERARDRRFDRSVILKRALSPENDEILERRLARQARAPLLRVVSVLDLARDEAGRPIGVLEPAAGGTLATWAEAAGRTHSLPVAIDLFRSFLSSLAEIHDAGLAHGNLSLDHLLLEVVDEGLTLVRLTSFADEPAEISNDLVVAGKLLRDLTLRAGFLPELEELLARAELPGEFPDARSFRRALRRGELASWTRVAHSAEQLENAPSDPLRPTEALLAGSRRLLDEENWDLGLDLALEVLRQEEDHPEAKVLLHRARTALEARSSEESSTRTRVVRTIEVLLERGDLDDARDELKRAVTQHGESATWAGLRQQITDAEFRLEEDRRKQRALDELVDRARESYASGDFASADALLTEASSWDPDSTLVTGLLETVRTAAEAASPPTWLDELRHALAHRIEAGDPVAATRILARLAHETDEHSEDLGLWQLKVCGLWSERSEGLLEAGRIEEARTALGEAQRLAPGSSEVQRVSERLERARDRARADERQRARGETLAEICHLIDGDRLREAWDLHQTAQNRLGSWPELEKIGTEVADLLVAEAQWNAARGRIDEAADFLRRATVVDPRNPHARSLLAATEAAVLVERQERRTNHLLQQAVRSISEMISRGKLAESRAALEFARGRFGDHEELHALEAELESSSSAEVHGP